MEHLVRDWQADPTMPLGGKARALARMRDADFPIPPWAVVLPDAFLASLSPEALERLEQATTAAQMRAALEHLELPPALNDELRPVLAELSAGGALLAVRSSAADEDGARHSFAGQLDSFLFVPAQDVPGRILDVWRSGFSERIVSYRREHHLPLTPRPPAVLLQRMIDAEAAGVAFGADPVSGRRGVAVVSAVYGLGTALVSGEASGDTWHVDREKTILERHVVEKGLAHRAAPGCREGVRAVPVARELAGQPVLCDEQVLAVAELAWQSGKHLGRPQDIEWALAGGELFLLQSRPITSLGEMADPDGVRNLWDNSNIAESYNGVTTPLTFSFARRAYEEVYRQFCRMLGVPEAVIEANDDIFRRMLGLVGGTVYYNLLNWYRLLALLPGFKANRAFMEQMMGVREPLPASLIDELARTSWTERLRDRFRLARSVLALVRHHWTLPRQIQRFYSRLDDALGKTRPDLDGLRPDEIVARYRDLERRLLTRWDAPLLNDFFAMVFFGVLGKLTRTWCGDANGTLQNDLLCGEGDMISAEPARRVRALAEAALPHPPLIEALCSGNLPDVRRTRTPTFARLFDEYLERFGDRCLEELKLESSTLFDDPTTLLRSVGQLAQRLRDGPPLGESAETALRARAEARVEEALRGSPLRRWVFHWVLRHARARVRDRENLRFERTRLFGRVRQLVVALGRHLHALDRLDDPRDVFFLELHELLDFVEGTATCTDLRGLAALRKEEFTRYREGPRPPDRFETRGLVYVGQIRRSPVARTPGAGEERSGLGCCPGVVRGRARVITDPRGASLQPGEILVAERTDPGWILLFPAARGLLVERGSLLSHSAIVAREMGIPAIVSLPDVTCWLVTGDEVEMDGASGVVRRLSGAASPNVEEPPALAPCLSGNANAAGSGDEP